MSFGPASSDLREGPPRGASGPAGRIGRAVGPVGRRSLLPPPSRHRGSARFALGFVAGCATVLPWAAYLSFSDAHPPASAGAYYGLHIAAKVGACALATLPISGIVLALMQLRHSFTVASAGWALSMMFSMLLSMLAQGGALPAWVYGLCSGLCYGTAALLSVSPAARSRAEPAPAGAVRPARAPIPASIVHIDIRDADSAESAAQAHEVGEPGS
jgi:O-antigen/teichoic acid export membrane protein